jgi:hypothetical protein
MLMRGDFNKIIEHINPAVEAAHKRCEELEARVKALEEALEAKKAPAKKAPAKAA